MALGYSSLVRYQDWAIDPVIRNAVVIRVSPTSQEYCSMTDSVAAPEELRE
jgi:hypothetical protein